MVDAGRIGFVPKGNYSATTTYEKLDVVKYERSSYVALQTTTGNPPTDTDNWQPIAEVLLATQQDPGIVRPDGTSIMLDPDGTIHGHAAAGVDSFNGRSGSVLPMAGDYDAHQIVYTSGQTASNVGEQLDTLISGMMSGSVRVMGGLITHNSAPISVGNNPLYAEKTVKFNI